MGEIPGPPALWYGLAWFLAGAVTCWFVMMLYGGDDGERR
jgi:hypothetical protein